MKHIPETVATVFSKRMDTAGILQEDCRQYFKWLRYYLDFCEKYKLTSTDTVSSNAFMLKLNEKGQTPDKQRQAAQSVNVYLNIGKRTRVDHPVTAEHDSGKMDWEVVFRLLKEAIRIRNYSSKTYSTYASRIGRFEQFIPGKAPDQITMNDVKSILTSLAVHSQIAAPTQNQAFTMIGN